MNTYIPLSSSIEEDDIVLIRNSLSGSQSDLDKLIRRHYNFIYNVAIRFVLSPDDAEDLTQEVLLIVISKLSQFQFESEFRTWLYKIVFHHFLNSKRRKMELIVTDFQVYGQGLDSIPNQELSLEESLHLKEEIEDAKLSCMTGMLICLTRDQRLIFILGEIFQIDSEIGGSVLNISPENYRKKLSRARKELYNFMNQKCGLILESNPCRCPKKTKGFIDAGWVNAEDLKFNNHFTEKIVKFVEGNKNQCDSLLEEKYGSLFKDHPFYDKSTVKGKLIEFENDPEVRKSFSV